MTFLIKFPGIDSFSFDVNNHYELPTKITEFICRYRSYFEWIRKV